jgi:hypothetical protein
MGNTTKGRFVVFGREVCGDLVQAQQREWLVTNGIAGYASDTIAYHPR